MPGEGGFLGELRVKQAQATVLAMQTALQSSMGITHTESREPYPPWVRELMS